MRSRAPGWLLLHSARPPLASSRPTGEAGDGGALSLRWQRRASLGLSASGEADQSKRSNVPRGGEGGSFFTSSLRSCPIWTPR